MPCAADGVDEREVELRVVGVEVAEEVEDLLVHLVGPRVGAVDLVDDDDDREPELEALAQDEARLRERALGGVDEEQRAVGHEQRALDLAAEVGVARGVDDVDLASSPAPANARVLREDRDAALALEVVGVHHALDDDLVRAERPGLAEHVVDERGLAVVDVRRRWRCFEARRGVCCSLGRGSSSLRGAVSQGRLRRPEGQRVKARMVVRGAVAIQPAVIAAVPVRPLILNRGRAGPVPRQTRR